MARRSRGTSQNLWHAAQATLIVVVSVVLIVFSGYLVQLDREVRERFAGARWALPAQVYAAPLELYPGERIGPAELGHELQRLGYREVRRLGGAGTFAIADGRVTAHTREFRFWDGLQQSQLVAIDFAGARVTRLTHLGSGEPIVLLRFDPMLIGSIYPQQGEDRVLVRLDEVPPLLREGLLAVEDRGFYDHFGISLRGIARAAWVNLRAGRTVQGASTITQQLVRNFFLTLDRTWKRKVNEILMAVLLEAHYGKEEILEAYINEIHLGQDGSRAVHGFGLGSHFYFNKPLEELQSHEIALLVGLIKGSSYYNPRRNPARALERRNLVLQVFRDAGLIDEAEYAAASARPLGLSGEGRGGVERYPAFVELVKRQLRGQYQEADLTDEGLRIFTTLEPRAQEALERNISRGVDELEKSREMTSGTLEAAGVVTSVDRGDVVALVGGRRVRYPGYNRALDSRRSIGSLVKPFVYLSALRRPERYNLHTELQDEPIELRLPNRQIWAPKNYDKKLHGSQPLYLALAQSLNLPTVALGLDVGVEAVLETMHDAGYSGQIQPLPSALLGAVDIAPIEVAQMYGTLAAGGFQSPLSAIREVLTKEGTPLNRYPLRVEQTLPEGPVYLIDWAMMQVMRLGTGRSALGVLPPGTVVAGKTGTTDDLRDSWFAGFGGDRLSVVWLGRDDYQPMGFTGSSGALYIWSRLMRDLDVRSFEPIPPPDVVDAIIDPVSGLKADEGCQRTMLIPYLRGSAPTDYAPCADAAQTQPLQWLREIFQ